MAYKTNNSITNVARRLLLDEFNKTAYMFKLNEFEKIELYCSEKGFDGGYVITTEFLKLAISTLGTFDYVETDIYGNEYEYSQADWFDYYWLKSDYFQCVARFGVAETDIKKLKAFEAMRSFQFIQERQIEAEQSEQDQRLKADFKVISEIFMDEVKEFAECGLCGTAAVISPVGKIVDHGKEICFPSGMEKMGPTIQKLYDTLTGIQMGQIEAPKGWIQVIE